MGRVFINLYIALAIAVVGLGLLVWAWVNFKTGLKTRRWIRVDGRVISSHVEQSGTTIEFDHPTYQTHAKVEYEVNGIVYRTSKVNDFIGSVESIGKPGSLPRNSKINVYYNPEDPGEAVMDRAALRFSIFLGLLGIGFIVLEWHWVTKTFFQ